MERGKCSFSEDQGDTVHLESVTRRPLLRTVITVGAVAALTGSAFAPAAAATTTAAGVPASSPTLQQPAAGVIAATDHSKDEKGRSSQRGPDGVGQPISPEEAFARGETWLNPPVPYSMSAYTGDPNGKSYRTDCSGFVSMAWHLPNSETTVTLPESTVETISWDSLAPGDAVNRSLPGGSGHVMLVEKVEGSTVHVMEQTPPQVTRSTHDKATLSATGYDAVRYKKMMAVSEEDVRREIEKRLSTVEKRINERLQEEVGNSDDSGSVKAGAKAGVAGAAAPDNDEDRNDGREEWMPKLDPRIQPPNSKTLVNFDSVFSVRDQAYQEIIAMPETGVEVEVYAEQTGWLWNWDDGSDPQPTEHGGKPYPQRPQVTHNYHTAGTYQPSVDVEWGNYRYRIIEQDDDWTDIEGDTTTALQFADLEVVELQNVLSD